MCSPTLSSIPGGMPHRAAAKKYLIKCLLLDSAFIYAMKRSAPLVHRKNPHLFVFEQNPFLVAVVVVDEVLAIGEIDHRARVPVAVVFPEDLGSRAGCM